jgi:hypothetical protein
MSEPASSGVAGYALFKWGVAIGLPAATVAVIVMVLTRPKDTREWVCALASTFAASIYGGAFAIRYFNLQSWVLEPDSTMALGGVYAVCGLPAWVLVRAGFAWFEKRRNKDLGELATDAKATLDIMQGKTNASTNPNP